jgi:hypothetical protein
MLIIPEEHVFCDMLTIPEEHMVSDMLIIPEEHLVSLSFCFLLEFVLFKHLFICFELLYVLVFVVLYPEQL